MKVSRSITCVNEKKTVKIQGEEVVKANKL